MTVYNHDEYLDNALQAILNQSRMPDEIIIVDDGSTDASSSIMERWKLTCDRVKVIRNERNLGVLVSIKKALDAASGSYIYCGSADDFVLPSLFEKSMASLIQHPEAGLCFSDPVIFSSETYVMRESRLGLSPSPCYFPPKVLTRVLMGKSIAGHTSIMKRSAFDEAGGFIPDLEWHADWFVTLVISFRHGACYVPASMAALRVNNVSYSKSGMRTKRQRKILRTLLQLLNAKEYRDVAPYFAKSRVMCGFGTPLLTAALTDPKVWTSRTVTLLAPLLWNEVRATPRKLIGRLTPSPIKSLYRRVRQTNQHA
jgi:glycosyltransferase involved in cell wall biosynthesis